MDERRPGIVALTPVTPRVSSTLAGGIVERVRRDLAANGEMRVLYVDDQGTFAEVVQDWLDSCFPGRYSIIGVADGDVGLELARAIRPDVLVTDIFHPGLRGDDLVDAVRADPALAHVPVGVISALGENEFSTTAPLDFCLRKPFDLPSLSSVFETLHRDWTAGTSAPGRLEDLPRRATINDGRNPGTPAPTLL